MAQLSKTILIFIFFSCLNADLLTKQEIKKLIGKTIILGFKGDLSENLKKDIDNYSLGGVILFNKDYKTKKLTL